MKGNGRRSALSRGLVQTPLAPLGSKALEGVLRGCVVSKLFVTMVTPNFGLFEK